MHQVLASIWRSCLCMIGVMSTVSWLYSKIVPSLFNCRKLPSCALQKAVIPEATTEYSKIAQMVSI